MLSALVPVMVTPFWVMQLLNAARARALMLPPPPKPPPKPVGAYFSQALNAAASALLVAKPPKPPAPGLRCAVGNAVGRAVGRALPDGKARGLNVVLTPCDFRQVSNALNAALPDELALAVGLGT